VAQFEERKVGRWTVRIDRLICVGFGDCIDEAGSWFELDEEGIATFRPTSSGDENALLEACRSCPVDALSVYDPEGGRLVP
jgi:ferredoxin